MIGFDLGPPELSREALRCLANAMLLKPSTRQTLVDFNYGGRIAEMLQVRFSWSSIDCRASNLDKANGNEDEFLCSRILFLLTYGTSVDFQELILKHKLAQSVNEVHVPSSSSGLHIITDLN